MPSDATDLRRRLERTFASAAKVRTAVAVSAAGKERLFGGLDSDAPSESRPDEWPLALGCVAKLLTSMLVLDAVHGGACTLDEPVHALLRAGRAHREALAGTTLRHLLEHTHGLAEPSLHTAPLLGDGSIDAAGLLDRVRGKRRWPAGTLYSYSEVGPWIAAAAIERVLGQRYEDALRARVLLPAGIGASTSIADGAACPSRGGGLRLSVGALVRVVEIALSPPFAWPGVTEAHEITPLPGWHVVERGIHLGWKRFDGGWYGHNSIYPSIIVRALPHAKTVVIVASRDHPASLVAARVLGSALPDFRDVSIPKPLSPDAAAALDLSACCGRYGSTMRTVAIEREGGALRLRGDDFLMSLLPAAGDLFFVRPARPGRPAYVQLLQPSQGGFRYLWDGQQLLENLELNSDAAPPDRTCTAKGSIP